MENESFRSLSAALAMHFGAPNLHVSGTGARFKSSRKGKATLYHTGIAPGNQAEIAFDVPSMAERLQLTEAEFLSFVAQLRASTGRPVGSHPYNWPRVGVATRHHVTLVMEALQQRLPDSS